jgi:sugar diacid utilization regulator
MIGDRAEREDLHRVLEVCSELTAVATADGQLDKIVDVVARGARVSAAVVDGSLAVLATNTRDAVAGFPTVPDVLAEEGEAVSQLTKAASDTRRALSLPAFGHSAASLVVSPIVVGDDCVAHLLTAGRDVEETGEDDRIMITEHAAMVSGVILARRRVVAIAGARARRELFEGLLLVRDRSEAELDNWASHLGLAQDARHRVLVIIAEPGEDSRLQPVIDHIETFVSARLPTAVVVNRDTEVVALMPGEHDTALNRRLIDIGRSCRRAIASRFATAKTTAGVSDSHTGAREISTSYVEARRAVDIGRVLPGLSDVMVFSELGIHRLLAQVRDTAELDRFVDSVLGKLVEYDRTNGVDYCRTLSVYFREQGSPQRAARILHTHPNTVTYRVRRAEQIAGCDLSSYSDRLAVQLALEIVNGRGGAR